MRTIRKTSPPMRGADVRRLQQALAVNPFARALGQGGGFAPGPIDGIAGAKTIAAIKRAKHALGYPRPNESGGWLLLAYLEKRRKITPGMRKRREARIAAWEEAQKLRPHIVRPKWSWRSPPVPRLRTTHIVFHHAAKSQATPQDIWRSHLNRGFRGAGYNYYVGKDGVITQMRPPWATGAHTEGYNSCAIGVCCEGNYEVDKVMPAEQLGALLWLRDELARKYPKARRIRHRDVNATACPGLYFPWLVVK
jgi:hypothetical protein